MSIRTFLALASTLALGCSSHSSSAHITGDMGAGDLRSAGDLNAGGGDLKSASGDMNAATDLNASSDDLLQSGGPDLLGPRNDLPRSSGDGGASLCSSIQGTFRATGVSCNGTPLPSTEVSNANWYATVNGTAASFSQDPEELCTLVSSGTIECLSDDEFTLIWSKANTCSGPACAEVWGTTTCSATPVNYELTWITSNVTSTSFVATSTISPNGSPTPLTTCTSVRLSNPIQVTWTKQ